MQNAEAKKLSEKPAPKAPVDEPESGAEEATKPRVVDSELKATTMLMLEKFDRDIAKETTTNVKPKPAAVQNPEHKDSLSNSLSESVSSSLEDDKKKEPTKKADIKESPTVSDHESSSEDGSHAPDKKRKRLN